MKSRYKYRAAALLICFVFLLGAFASCKFETVAEHESRLAKESTVLLEEKTDAAEPEEEPAGSVAEDFSSVRGGEAFSDPGDKESGQTERNNNNGSANVVNGQESTLPDGKTTTPSRSSTTSASTQNPEQNITVTISITCAVAVGNSQLNSGITLPPDGAILAESHATVKNGTSIFALLKAVCAQKDISLQYQGSVYGSYVLKIGPIGEKDCGAQSGWTYRVNGVIPSVSADRYKALKDGDKIEWVYVTHA